MSKLARAQWDYLWENGFLGENNSTSLFYAVYVMFISVTGVTAGALIRVIVLYRYVGGGGKPQFASFHTQKKAKLG